MLFLVEQGVNCELEFVFFGELIASSSLVIKDACLSVVSVDGVNVPSYIDVL